MSTRRITKQNKSRVFLFFLLFSTLLWVLTKFSKQYSSKVNVWVDYQNLPENTLLSDAPKTISVNLIANGFEFLYYRLKQPIAELNLNKYYKEGENIILVDREALQMEISRDLEREVNLTDVSIKNIEVKLDRIANKEVPIIIDADVQLRKGFRQVDSIQIHPSRVIVSAPSQVLDSIEFISTAKWEARNVDKSTEKTLKLILPKFEKTFLDLEHTEATIEVTEYTQKNLQVPITLVNKPSNMTLMLIPEVISLAVDVDIAAYNSISDQDFIVICDYNKRDEEEGKLYAELKTFPKQVYNVKLSETSIDYLIFK